MSGSGSDSSEGWSNEEEPFPTNMEEWEDKWWLTKKDEKVLGTMDTKGSTGYVCKIHHENTYDGSGTDTQHFKTLVGAYNHVCDFLTQKYKTFGGKNLSLYKTEDMYGDYPEYEKSLEDWKNCYFLLNYGSSSGATPYTITVEAIQYNDCAKNIETEIDNSDSSEDEEEDSSEDEEEGSSEGEESSEDPPIVVQPRVPFFQALIDDIMKSS